MSETPKIKIPSTPKVKDKNHIPEWHKQQELILKRWSEIGGLLFMQSFNDLLIDEDANRTAAEFIVNKICPTAIAFKP